MPAQNNLQIPEELAASRDYEVIRELGRGGMGVVYLARNKMMDRLEVLKVLNKAMLQKKGMLERFMQEIRSAARLSHPNVVAAHSALQLGDLTVFVMEYVEGKDLAEVIRENGPLSIANSCYYIYQAALGLQQAHLKGMVHRDIKPSNLILARDGKNHVVKILDFGLAKASSENQIDGGLTSEGQMLGTPDYVAPEQILNSSTADIRADIYSLGCTLYYLLSGKPPFHGSSLMQILYAHQNATAKPLIEIRPEVSVELSALVARMMAKDPAKRFQTPGEVAAALAPIFRASQREVNPAKTEPLPSMPKVNPLPSSPSVDPTWTNLDVGTKTRHSTAPRSEKESTSRTRQPKKKPWWQYPAPLVGIGVAMTVAAVVAVVLLVGGSKDKVKTVENVVLAERKPDAGVAKIKVNPPTLDGNTPVDPKPEKKVEPKEPIEDKPKEVNQPVDVFVPMAPKPGEGRIFDVGNGVKMSFCWIPGTNGMATLGSPKEEASRRADEEEHQVELDGFWMAKTEMTQAQYIKLTGKKNPSYFCAEGGGKDKVGGRNTDDFPVEQVSWDDAQECIKGMKVPPGGKRIGLPSEAQWEWACRGGKGNSQAFAFGVILNGNKANNDGNYPYGTTQQGANLGRTAKVGIYESTATHPWGLSDMHGNVWEWCADYYGDYDKLPRGKNPVQSVKQLSDDRVLRGGSWYDRAEGCRAACRLKCGAVVELGFGGFRVCLRLDGEPKDTAKPVVDVVPIEPKTGEERRFGVGNGVRMTFCWIPGTNGMATLGSPKGEAQRNENEEEHQVELDGFWMAKTEMTQGHYVKLTGKKNPSWFCADGGGKNKVVGVNTDDFPVEQVSWEDAQTCIGEMQIPQGVKRIALPTESQWEWACRGGKGNGQAFSFGDILNGDKANSRADYPYGTTTKGTYLGRTEKVESYVTEAAHPWGLSDMHGNVWEWCEDYYDKYDKLPRGKNPVQTVKQHDGRRVLRGGSFFNYPVNCRSAYRSNGSPGYRYGYIGFRVVFVP